MTRAEFSAVMTYVSLAIGKRLTADTLEVYFDLLGDLPAAALQTAARRVLLEHRWATFPSPAELREAATATLRGEITGLSAAEAWRIAWAVASSTDPELCGDYERALRKHRCPPLVAE